MLGFVMPNVAWMNSGVKASPVRRPISNHACLVRLERVDEHPVVVEDGEVGVGCRGQGRLLVV